MPHSPETHKQATPAAEHLREVNDQAEKLPEKQAQLFHTIVARSLFCGKRARPDTLPTVAFLCTRVKWPDVDDWKKLTRMITYLNQTAEDVLTLSADNLRIVKWWVDGSYAVHEDCKSQTGGTMSMGKGSVFSSSQKQKINTKSSTETELVAADDMMPQILWTTYFLDEQGYGGLSINMHGVHVKYLGQFLDLRTRNCVYRKLTARATIMTYF